MKNNKGFTLVEILAVIVILSIIMIITTTSIMKPFNNGKQALSKINTKNLQDAAETVIVEVINCNVYDSTYAALNQSKTNCTTLQDAVIGKTVTTTVEKLKENNYFVDTNNNCSGELKITTTSSTYKVSVDVTGVTCK